MTPEKVINEVCIAYGVTEAELRGKSAAQAFSTPRHMAYLIMNDVLKMSQSDTCRQFNRHRTSVNQALPRARWFSKHPEHSEAIAQITRMVKRCPWTDVVKFRHTPTDGVTA